MDDWCLASSFANSLYFFIFPSSQIIFELILTKQKGYITILGDYDKFRTTILAYWFTKQTLGSSPRISWWSRSKKDSTKSFLSDSSRLFDSPFRTEWNRQLLMNFVTFRACAAINFSSVKEWF